MAKKARKKPEPDEAAFEFPEFDERAFLAHEFEQFYATVLAFVLGIVIGLAAFGVGEAGVPWEGGFGVGIVGVVVGALAIRSLRPRSFEYTKGDWASLIVVMFFGFLGVWLLVADIIR